MRNKYTVILMLLGSLCFSFPASLSSAPEEQKKTGFLDNDELAKALAELGDDTPAVYSEAETAVPEAAEVKNTESPKPAETEKLLKPEEDDEVVFRGAVSGYKMIRHLSEVDAQIMEIETEEKISGIWKKGSFTFPGFEATEIRLQKVTFPAGQKPAIVAKILPGHLYRLKFSGVPPFSRLNLQYLLQDPESSKTLNYMYLKVFVGQYELKRIQVSSKDAWLKTSLEVGAVSFLNQDVPVVFEFGTNQATGLTFSLIPDTE